MDMWKAFRNSTAKNAPQAAILFDKFHVLRHLSEALDKIRKQEYARLSGRDRWSHAIESDGDAFSLLACRTLLLCKLAKPLLSLTLLFGKDGVALGTVLEAKPIFAEPRKFDLVVCGELFHRSQVAHSAGDWIAKEDPKTGLVLRKEVVLSAVLIRRQLNT